MPMDALRMSQIREALDDDKKMYGQAFDIVKRYVATTKDEPVAYVQLNQDDIKSAGELIGTFQELLEKKLAEITTRIRTNSGEAPESDSDIGLVQDVVNAYNKIISIAINPGNTQQTKQALMTEVMKSQATITRMEALLVHVLDRMAATNDETILRPGFGVFLKAYNVYNLINKQLAGQRLVIITSGDLSHNLEGIYASNPRWRAVMSRYNLKPPDYQPIAPDGASGQGPTPPRPPGGGPPGGGPGGDLGPGGGPSPGGPFGTPSTQDSKDTQTDAKGDVFEDADDEAKEEADPAATAFSSTTRPDFLPSGAETIEPSSSGPQSAAVPQPVRNPAFDKASVPGGVPIFNMTGQPSREEDLLRYERDRWQKHAVEQEAIWKQEAAAQAAQLSRLQEQLSQRAPSRLASQVAPSPSPGAAFEAPGAPHGLPTDAETSEGDKEGDDEGHEGDDEEHQIQATIDTQFRDSLDNVKEK